MPTQASLSIPFSIVHPQQNVRLLELPPELLQVVEDKSSNIQLKSAPPSTSSTSTTPKEQHLHLCTDNHVWAVRQVSTSNSVHVLAPSTHNDPSSTIGTSGVAAFAQPTSTLELFPAPFTTADIDAAIRRLLAVHPAPHLSTGSETAGASITAAELDASLPYPHADVAQAKRRCFVFKVEAGDSSGQSYAYVPSPQLLLAAWSEFSDQLAIQGSSLAGFELDRLEEVLSPIAMSDGPLLPAVVRAIAAEFADADGGGLERRLQGGDVTRFVGALLVQCAPEGQIESAELVAKWQNLLPTEWWKWCEVQELAETCAVGLGSVVRWREKGDHGDGAVPSSKFKETEKAPAASAPPGKRNWHEKFAAQRKR